MKKIIYGLVSFTFNLNGYLLNLNKNIQVNLKGNTKMII